MGASGKKNASIKVKLQASLLLMWEGPFTVDSATPAVVVLIAVRKQESQEAALFHGFYFSFCLQVSSLLEFLP